jgi:hypothetical protein
MRRKNQNDKTLYSLPLRERVRVRGILRSLYLTLTLSKAGGNPFPPEKRLGRQGQRKGNIHKGGEPESFLIPGYQET